MQGTTPSGVPGSTSLTPNNTQSPSNSPHSGFPQYSILVTTDPNSTPQALMNRLRDQASQISTSPPQAVPNARLQGLSNEKLLHLCHQTFHMIKKNQLSHTSTPSGQAIPSFPGKPHSPSVQKLHSLFHQIKYLLEKRGLSIHGTPLPSPPTNLIQQGVIPARIPFPQGSNFSQLSMPPQIGQKRPASQLGPLPYPTNYLQSCIQSAINFGQTSHPLESPQKKPHLSERSETEEKEFARKAQRTLQQFQDLFNAPPVSIQKIPKVVKRPYLLTSDFDEMEGMEGMKVTESQEVEKGEKSTIDPVPDLPFELFEMILTLLDKEDIKNMALVSRDYREKTLASFCSGSHGARIKKYNKVFKACSNFNLQREIEPKPFALDYGNYCHKKQIADLYWIKDNVIAVLNKQFKSKIMIPTSLTSKNSIEFDFVVESMEIVGNNKLLLSVKECGQEIQIIYNFLKRKISAIFFNNSKTTLSNQQTLFIRDRTMTLVNFKEEELKMDTWIDCPEKVGNRVCALSENRLIADCNNVFKIFDFSCQQVFSIPNSLFQLHTKSVRKAPIPKRKEVAVINEKEIIIQVGSHLNLYKIAIPENLEKEEKFFVSQKLEREDFTIHNTSEQCILSPISLDSRLECLWIPVRKDNYRYDGILKIDFKDLSHRFFPQDNLQQKIRGIGKIKTIGNTLFHLRSKSTEVWEIFCSSLHYLYSIDHKNLKFNQEMTAFAYPSKNQIVEIQDYSS